MRIEKFYIADVLKDLQERIIGVSANVFCGHRPSATQTPMENFIVISFPARSGHQKVQHSTIVRFDIAAGNILNGLENTPVLQAMLDSLVGIFPIVGLDGRYSVASPMVVMSGDDGLGFTHWLVNADIKINKTDSYRYND